MDERLRHRRRAKCSGRRPTSAGPSATATSSTRRCCTAARRSSTRASRSARRMPARSGASARSTACSVLFTAPTAFRAIKREDPGGHVTWRRTTCRASACCFSPASAAIPTRCCGREEQLGVPVIDHWWQTETGLARRSPTASASAMLPVKPGSPTKPVPGYDIRVLGRRRPRDAAPARSARSSSSCRCRRAACPTLWNNDDGFEQSYLSQLSRLLPDRRRRLQGRGRLLLRDEPRRRHHQRRRPPAVDRRDGGGARRRIPTSPSARSIGVGRRAQGRGAGRASSCSRPA